MNKEPQEEKVQGIGDPQIYRGKAGGPPRFKPGEAVRVIDMPDLFYSRCQYYTRGVVGTILKTTHESPAAEDEAWDNVGKVEWFYMLFSGSKICGRSIRRILAKTPFSPRCASDG